MNNLLKSRLRHAERQRAYAALRRASGLCHTCGLKREDGNEGWVCRRPECVTRRREMKRRVRQADVLRKAS